MVNEKSQCLLYNSLDSVTLLVYVFRMVGSVTSENRAPGVGAFFVGASSLRLIFRGRGRCADFLALTVTEPLPLLRGEEDASAI
jgi:hypothetical protein